MREFPKGGMIGKTVHFARSVSRLRIPLYAANASFFIILAVFPALLLLLELLQYTTLDVHELGLMFRGIMPTALLETAEDMILEVYDHSSGVSLSVSAVVMLWSASRGIQGVMTGLNAVYDVSEDRGYFYTKLVSMVYMFAFLIVLVLTLGLHVFSSGLISLLKSLQIPMITFLANLINFRFFLLLIVQTAFFTAMFMALPNERNRFWESLPGALLASSGWLIFSDIYSIYVENFASLSNIYGSVYAIALSMLWLYCCMAIVFYGGALNRYLMEG